MNWKLSAFADEIGFGRGLQSWTLQQPGTGEVHLRGIGGKNFMELSIGEFNDLRGIAQAHGLSFHAAACDTGTRTRLN